MLKCLAIKIAAKRPRATKPRLHGVPPTPVCQAVVLLANVLPRRGLGVLKRDLVAERP
jgi:hypothetical protein